MPKKTHGLGRGLDSLFQDMETGEPGSGILEIVTSFIKILARILWKT